MSEKKFNNVLNSVKNAAGKVSEKANAMAEDAKNAAVQLKEEVHDKQVEYKANLVEKKKQEDLKKYAPIFPVNLSNGELLTERFIRIINYDARLENDVCEGSIGYYEKTDDRKLITLYSKHVSSLGMTFYPQMSESVFVADPCVPGKFIEIDEYFNYMKQVRVNELTVVAQTLGAKRVSIGLRHASKSIFHSSADGNAKVGGVVDAKVSKKEKKKNTKEIAIWADTSFKTSLFNGAPTIPELLYFKNESDISALIQMVIENKSKVTSRQYSMKASSSSGVSVSEAASISGTLKKSNAVRVLISKKTLRTRVNRFWNIPLYFNAITDWAEQDFCSVQVKALSHI